MARARKVLRIRRVSLVSAAWVGGLLGLVQGVLQALVFLIAPALLGGVAAAEAEGEIRGLVGFLAALGFAMLLVLPLAGAVLGALWSAILAFLLNIVLALVGGFAMEVE